MDPERELLLEQNKLKQTEVDCEYLKNTDRGEQEVAEGGTRAEGFESLQPILHATPSNSQTLWWWWYSFMHTRRATKENKLKVKLIKCIVQNLPLDISFSQLGGLSKLCFLEQIDRLIGKDHLFKRSVILVKTRCYYESRILSANHGLLSTYALDTLVMYIFHLFHSSLSGPLAVLHRFLDYYSKFDWDKYCISLSGPAYIAALPEIVVEKPENAWDELFFYEECLRGFVNAFSIPREVPETKTFLTKYLNIIDPLNESNNLGRSVSKGCS